MAYFTNFVSNASKVTLSTECRTIVFPVKFFLIKFRPGDNFLTNQLARAPTHIFKAL